jgi:hypothetical protein
MVMGLGEGLTIENGKEVISIYGQINFSSDAAGMEKAKELLALFEQINEMLADNQREGDTLWVQNKKGILIVGGSVDLEKGMSSKIALSKPIKSLKKFCSIADATTNALMTRGKL